MLATVPAAYVSLDTVMVRESGTISFKAIPEEKPLEVIYMAPELQTKGVLNEKVVSVKTNMLIGFTMLVFAVVNVCV